MESLERISTGFEGLDEIIDYLRLGDNVVWRVNDIKDYETCARLFVTRALLDKRKVVYMRFSDRAPRSRSTCCSAGPFRPSGKKRSLNSPVISSRSRPSSNQRETLSSAAFPRLSNALSTLILRDIAIFPSRRSMQ